MILRFLLVCLLAAGCAFAQDEGGGGGGGGMGGGGGRGGGGGGGGMGMSRPSKLDQIGTACNLSKDQKKQFKTILDGINKDAEDIRKQLPTAQKAMQTAIIAGKSGGELQQAIDAYASLNTQMTVMETKAFGVLFKTLDADQTVNADLKKQRAQRLLNLMGGIFANKNWDQ